MAILNGYNSDVISRDVLVKEETESNRDTSEQNLNLNSLQVKRQIDNLSPGAVTGGKLVPSSHKRGELRYTII